MSWYSVKTLTRSTIIGVKTQDTLFDESLMLIEAKNTEEAKEKAEKIAKEEYQPTYKNESGETVQWVFEKILEVTDLCEERIYSGIQVYSHLYRKEEPDSKSEFP